MNRIMQTALAALAFALPGHAWASSAECQARAQTPVQLSGCLQQAFTREDSRLNHVYQRLVATLAPRDKQTLRAAQRQWIMRRDARCESKDDTIDQACMVDMTQTRADTLAARLR